MGIESRPDRKVRWFCRCLSWNRFRKCRHFHKMTNAEKVRVETCRTMRKKAVESLCKKAFFGIKSHLRQLGRVKNGSNPLTKGK